MEPDQFQIEPLREQASRKAFCCGSNSLDHYLQRLAKQDAKRHISATFLLIETKSSVIAGYYSLSSTAISLLELPETLQKKLPRYPLLPATLLGRLAIDQRFQQQGLGEYLLTTALKHCLDSSIHIGSMAVIVEAETQSARKFYQHFNFIEFPDSKNRLFLPMSTIKELWETT